MRHQTSLSAGAVLWSVLVAGSASADAQVAGPTTAPAAIAVADDAAPAARNGLDRIARRLHRPGPLRTADASRVDFAMRVSGDRTTPPIVLPGDLAIGAPVYGSPTHDEMLTLTTPAALRGTAPYRRYRPAVPLGR